MGEHNRTKKYIDLAHGDVWFREFSEEPWTCHGCGKSFKAEPARLFLERCRTGERDPGTLPFFEVRQPNGVSLNFCAVCACFAAQKDGDTFRMVHPGEFRPNCITDRMRKSVMRIFDEWKNEKFSYLKAFSELYPNTKYISAEESVK